jgi:hypothetical protein
MEADVESQTDLARPEEVKRGVLFLSASLVLGLLSALLNLAQNASGGVLLVALLIVIAFFALCFFVLRQIARGRNWARIIVLVVVGLLLLSLPVTLLLVPGALAGYLDDFRRNLFRGILGVVISILQLAGTYQLFTRNSNRWFKTQK